MQPPFDDPTDVEGRRLLREALPRAERIARVAVAGREERVRGHDAGEPVRVLRHEAQPNEAAPVLADERRPGQVERSSRNAVIQSTWRWYV